MINIIKGIEINIDLLRFKDRYCIEINTALRIGTKLADDKYILDLLMIRIDIEPFVINQNKII